MRPGFVVVLLAASWAASCGGAASAVAPSPAPTVPPSGLVVITLAQDRHTATAHLGDHIQIALGEQYAWSVEPPDGTVRSRPIQSYLLVRDTQAIWVAIAPGRGTVRATGTAVCPSGQPCPQLAILFMATVLVGP